MNVITDKFKKADENNRLLSAYRPLPPETLKSLREYFAQRCSQTLLLTV